MNETESRVSVLSDMDLTTDQTIQIIQLAKNMKAHPERYSTALSGKSIATIYEKPSLRTRVSFDVGIAKMGGHSVYLDQHNTAMGKREAVADIGANLSCWCDAIVARVLTHETLEQLKHASNVPVINSMCDLYHPCQALADAMTLDELFPKLSGLTLAYVGNGNHVSHSLLLTATKLGMHIVLVCPKGYGPDAQIWQKASMLAMTYGGSITIYDDVSALSGVNALYTAAWSSMTNGQDKEAILDTFAPYQITSEVMKNCGASKFLHCQPAQRDQEVTGEVLDSTDSVILQQAENRMWVQNALLLTLMNGN